MTIRKYGHKRGLYDPKDIPYKAQRGAIGALPPSVDLRPFCPAVRDQGQVGSCTAFSVSGLLRFVQMKMQLSDFAYSELDLYYNERVLEGTPGEDSGAEIRDGIKVAVTQGVCSEALWPYDEANVLVRPPDACRVEALKHEALQYQSIPQDLQQIKACLAEGYPVSFGFVVYASFESNKVAQTGIVPMPKRGEQVLGGHAPLLVGYETYKRRKGFWCQNSWGEAWGLGGYFFMPEAYIANAQLASDFWTVRTVE